MILVGKVCEVDFSLFEVANCEELLRVFINPLFFALASDIIPSSTTSPSSETSADINTCLPTGWSISLGCSLSCSQFQVLTEHREHVRTGSGA
jgi:hypothetical protein